MRALILGCGYLGHRVANRWLEQGLAVSALTRSDAKAKDLRSRGIASVIGDVQDKASLHDLPSADVVLYSIGYDRTSGADRKAVVCDGLKHALAALQGKARHLVFISTTSVYGQHRGEWVDEVSPTQPGTTSGQLALEAESIVADSLSRVRQGPRGSRSNATILRLSGLYGPGRLLRRIEQLRTGEPIPGDPDAWLNLIHVDDAASAVVLATERLLQGRSADPADVFLVADDQPVRRAVYYARLSELTGSPPPTFDPAAVTRSPGLGKRCRNERAKCELGLTLRYPTFHQGLADAVKQP